MPDNIPGNITISVSLAIVLIVLLTLAFNQQISYMLSTTKSAFLSMLTGASPNGAYELADDDDIEKMGNPKEPTNKSANQVSSLLDQLGYSQDAPWDAVLQATELDPSVYVNHLDFVKDVRRFSSGANFTSVADDNTSIDFTNYRGLRRPAHVPIGKSARQTPDIDETVLQRNKDLRW
jgi:hypothetical protein